jgi:hypothetical protein
MPIFLPAVYVLCVLTSFAAMLLLLRSYVQNHTGLLLWSALCFVFLALNNLLLLVDVLVLPNVDLMPLRQLSSMLAVGVLLYGFIWEVD